MIKFRVYPSQLIHYGKLNPARAEVMRSLGFDPTDWQFVSLCGRELIGRELDGEPLEWEPVCKGCLRAFARGQEQYRELERRFT